MDSAAKVGERYVPNGQAKPCKRCGKPFPSICGSHRYCLECKEAARKETQDRCNRRYYEASKEDAKRKAREAYHVRKEEILSARDSDEYRSYRRHVSKQRYRSSPRYSLNRRMSGGITRGLKLGKSGRSWTSMVDYTLTDLMRHLERQFPRGMTWENYGEWEVDHIVPLSSFDFTSHEEQSFKDAWALTNLRPLWRSDNRTKGARRTHLI